MNDNLGKILIGALVGAGLGYLLADWYIEFKMPTDCDDIDINPIDSDDEEWELDEEDEETVVMLDAKKPKSEKKQKDYTRHFEGRPELAKLAAKYRGELPTTEQKEIGSIATQIEFEPGDEVTAMWVDELSDLKSYDHPADQEISIISMEEYAADDELDHVTLNYFDDDVLTDELDAVISDPDLLVGVDALVSFGVQSGDNDIVYVRNNKLGIMYEVVRTNKDYAAPVPQPRRIPLSVRRGRMEKNGESEEDT